MDSYRVYFDKTKLDDALLKSYILEPDIHEASNYVENFALSLGVTANNIASPTPYIISRFAQLFCYMTVAQRKSTFSTGGSADKDSFALKYQMYRQLLKDCESSLTDISFTNGVQAKKRRFPLTMTMLRD